MSTWQPSTAAPSHIRQAGLRLRVLATPSPVLHHHSALTTQKATSPTAPSFVNISYSDQVLIFATQLLHTRYTTSKMYHNGFPHAPPTMGPPVQPPPLPPPGAVCVLRGFRIRPSTLDMYLALNGEYRGTNNGSFPPRYIFGSDGPMTDQASEVLRRRMEALGGYPENSHRTLVVLPLTLSSEPSPWAYVPYIFSFTFTEFRITAAAPAAQMPPGFERSGGRYWRIAPGAQTRKRE